MISTCAMTHIPIFVLTAHCAYRQQQTRVFEDGASLSNHSTQKLKVEASTGQSGTSVYV